MKLYEYMVVYSYPGGIGRMCVTRSNKINSYDELVSVDEIVRETITNVSEIQRKNAFVTDFKLLRRVKEEM